MSLKLHFLIIGLSATLLAACGTGTSEDAGNETPIKKEAKELTKTLVGKWAYDIPFMEKQVGKLKADIIAYIQKRNKDFKPTPQFNSGIDSLLKPLVNRKEWADWKIQFFPDGKFRLQTDGRELNSRIGYSSDYSSLFLMDTMEWAGKRQEVIGAAFRAFQLTQNTMMRNETLSIPMVKKKFIVQHKYIRQK